MSIPLIQLRALAEDWRSRKVLDKGSQQLMRVKTYEQCADELDRILSQAESAYPPMLPIPQQEQPQTYATNKIVIGAQAGEAEPAAIDPVLAKFYQVDSLPALVAAQSEHIDSLQAAAIRNVKPWEDTFPPTLLPKYLRDKGYMPSETDMLSLVAGPFKYHHKMNDLQTRFAEGFDRCRELTMTNIKTHFSMSAALARKP